ncbi:MAG TPA: sulfotransferase [Longimicrobium sp.]|nr:sulfotransferase [Longimicrobium sp.]
MLDDLLELEDAFDRRLPPEKLQGPPSRELLDAGARWAEAAWRAAERAGPAELSPADLAWGRALAERPVFICGAHRSGTTLLRDLLDGHPALAVLPAEGTWLTGLQPKLAALPEAERLPALGREWLRRIANPINQRPYWLLGRTGRGGSPYVEFARALLAWSNAFRGEHGEMAPHLAVALAWAWRTRGADAKARLWVDKTPTHERFLDRLWGAFPAAKVLHIVRDPLAVLASQKRLQERAFGSFAAPRAVLRDLATSYQIAARESKRAPERFHLLRYEDLYAAPDEVMRRVAAFLEIEPLPALLQPTVAGLPARNNSAFSSDGIAVSHGERDAALTAAEREMAAAWVGPLAERLSYSPGTPAAWRRAILRVKVLAWSPRFRRLIGRWTEPEAPLPPD